MFGMGAYAGDFFTGLRQEQQRALGERQKIATAFMQFKAQNPEASYADFRSFVEGMAGSDIYLRGALPADDILQELGKQGEQRKAENARVRSTQLLQAETQRQDILKTALDAARKAGIRDPQKAAEFAIKNYNIDPSQASTFTQGILSMNPESIWNQQDQDEADTLLGRMKPLIDSNMIADKSYFDSRIPDYLKGSPIGKSLLEGLGGSLDEHIEGRKRELFTTGVELLAKMGPNMSPDAAMAITRQYLPKEMNIDALQSMADTLWSRAQAEQQRMQGQYQLQLDQFQFQQDSRKQDVVNSLLGDQMINRAVTLGDKSTAEKLVGDRLRAMGYNEPTLINQVIEGVIAQNSVLQKAQYIDQQTKIREQIPTRVEQDFKDSYRAWSGAAAGLKGEALAAMRMLAGQYWIDDAGAAAARQIATSPEYAKADANTIMRAVQQTLSGRLQTRNQRQDYLLKQAGSTAFQPQRFEEYISQANTNMNSMYDEAASALADARKIKDPTEKRLRIQQIYNTVQFHHKELDDQMVFAADHAMEWVAPDSRQPFSRNAMAGVVARSRQRAIQIQQQAKEMLATIPQTPAAPAGYPSPSPSGRNSYPMPMTSDGKPYPMPSPSATFRSIVTQESGGRPGVVGPQTKYGRAKGATQLLDGTGAEMAKKLGVPWRPDLMTAKTPEAHAYQVMLGQAYFQEGLAKTGNVFGAALYYHGGPDQRKWGPKTYQYANEVVRRAFGLDRYAPMARAGDHPAAPRPMPRPSPTPQREDPLLRGRTLRAYQSDATGPMASGYDFFGG